MWQDLRYAIRGFWSTPGTTAVAVLSLALGIGATTGMFAVLSYHVTRKTHEMGAERAHVLSLMLGMGAKLVLAGFVTGLLGSIWLEELFRTRLPEAPPTNPWICPVVAVLSATGPPCRTEARVNYRRNTSTWNVSPIP